MTDIERWNAALFVAIDDLEDPRKDTRGAIANEHIWEEFMVIREELIRYAHSMFRAAE